MLLFRQPLLVLVLQSQQVIVDIGNLAFLNRVGNGKACSSVRLETYHVHFMY